MQLQMVCTFAIKLAGGHVNAWQTLYTSIIRAMKSQTTDSLHVHTSLSCTKSSIAECENKNALVQWWLRSQLLNADSHDFCSPVVTLIILKRMLITRFNREANSEHCTSSYPATQRVVTCSWLFVEAFMTRVKIESSDKGIKVIAGLQKLCESMIRGKCGCHNSCCSFYSNHKCNIQVTTPCLYGLLLPTKLSKPS